MKDKKISANGVTAHRGDSVRAPENTLAAFQKGIESGADWIETDVYRTADGQLVLCHDASTKRTSGVDQIIAKTNWNEIKQLDVAVGFRNEKGLSLQECPRHQMPILTEAIDLILKEKKSRLSIQPKMDCVDEIIALIKEKKAEEWVGFNDGSLPFMSRVKELAPAIPVFWDRGANFDVEKDIAIAHEKKFEALVVHYSGLTPEKVAQIRNAGLIPGAWTVNDANEMQSLLKMGVERIYTDNPKLLFEVKSKM